MGSEHKDFKGDVDVPESAIQVIDDAVVSKLPPGTKPTGISAFGASFWTRTARLDTEQDGLPKTYFLKTTYGDRGRSMMSGEFTSMSAIHAVMPDFCPRPIAWGSYVSIPNVHFFLCDFHEMTDELPDLHTFPAKLAELHRKGTSENGKYGFPCRTYHGNTSLDHGWADTWEEYFTSRTKVLLEMEQKAQGSNEEILELAVPFFEKVVPRLLRPLETGGRSIKPSLVHGDLWYGNASTDADTDLPIIYDAACFYAHNEYDLGVWRASWNKLGKPYFNRYFKHFPIAPPEEDHDDRNLLYATRVNILDSILYKGYSGYREKLISDMRKLVSKFPSGYEGWVAEQEHPANGSTGTVFTQEHPPQSIKSETVDDASYHVHDEVKPNGQEDDVPKGEAIVSHANDLQELDTYETSQLKTAYYDETPAKEQNELRHDVLLPDLNTGAIRDHTAGLTDFRHSIADFDKEAALAPRAATEPQNTDGIEPENTELEVQPDAALDQGTDLSTLINQEEKLLTAREEKPSETKKVLSNNDMNEIPVIEGLRIDAGSSTK